MLPDINTRVWMAPGIINPPLSDMYRDIVFSTLKIRFKMIQLFFNEDSFEKNRPRPVVRNKQEHCIVITTQRSRTNFSKQML